MDDSPEAKAQRENAARVRKMLRSMEKLERWGNNRRPPTDEIWKVAAWVGKEWRRWLQEQKAQVVEEAQRATEETA